MRFYRVSHYSDSGDGSTGYSFHTSLRAAQKALKDAVGGEDTPQPNIDAINIKPTRAGILAALNRYAVHPDNG